MDTTIAADYEYYQYKNLSLNASVYRAPQNRKNKAILYLHGGGLLYGSKKDLPSMYIHLLQEAGYDLIALDYPLAPEASLSDILDCLQQGLDWFKHNALSTLQLTSTDYFLFGRSAGAFLCLVLS